MRPLVAALSLALSALAWAQTDAAQPPAANGTTTNADGTNLQTTAQASVPATAVAPPNLNGTTTNVDGTNNPVASGSAPATTTSGGGWISGTNTGGGWISGTTTPTAQTSYAGQAASTGAAAQGGQPGQPTTAPTTNAYATNAYATNAYGGAGTSAVPSAPTGTAAQATAAGQAATPAQTGAALNPAEQVTAAGATPGQGTATAPTGAAGQQQPAVNVQGAPLNSEQLTAQNQAQAQEIARLRGTVTQLQSQLNAQDQNAADTSDQVGALNDQVGSLQQQVDEAREHAQAAEQNRLERVDQMHEAQQSLWAVHDVLESGSSDIEGALSRAEANFQSVMQGAAQYGGQGEVQAAAQGLQTVEAIREALGRNDMQAAMMANWFGQASAAQARSNAESGRASQVPPGAP